LARQNDAGYTFSVFCHKAITKGDWVGGFANFQDVAARWDYLARRGLAAAAAGAALLAILSIASEFSARKVFVQGALGPYRGTAEDLAQPTASVEGVYERFAACDAALTELITLLQPKDKRAQVAVACLSLADQVLRSAPTFSFAQLIRAVSLREMGQNTQARAALLLSEMTGGGNVQYAQRRAAIWVDEFSVLGADEFAALQRDILRLSIAPAGMAWLAGQYAQDPALRPAITNAINTLPERQKAAFLAAVRRLSQ
jgi:hypothetical protein